jgi:drug/metabolite transporter (DMT)-like permease
VKIGIRIRAYAFLAMAIVELSFMPIALKVGADAFGTAAFLLYSFMVASLASVAMVAATKSGRRLLLTLGNRRTLVALIAGGLMNYLLAAAFLTFGILHTTASLGGVIFRSWVIFAIPFIPLILKTRVNKYQIISLAIGFAAVFAALTQGTLVSINAAYAPYIAVLFMAALFAAFSNVIIKSQSGDVASQVFVFNISTFAVLAVVVPAAWGLGSGTLSVWAVLSVLFTGIVAYTLGAYLYFYALKALDVATVANATLVIPFLTFAFSALLLGEQIQPYYLILAALVVSGIALQQLSPTKASMRVRKGGLKHASPLFDVTSAFVDNRNEEIYGLVQGANRALASPGELAIDYDKMEPGEKRDIAERYRCLLFTAEAPHPGVNEEELDFVREILGVKDSEVLIGVGDPRNVEEAIEEMLRRHREASWGLDLS